MEEVWNNITLLPTLLHNTEETPTTAPLSLQITKRTTPTTTTTTTSNKGKIIIRDLLTGPFEQAQPPPAPPPPPPQDPIIDLNLDSSCYTSHRFSPSDPQLSFYSSRKRLFEQHINDTGFGVGDGDSKQRHTRMIKNRESAARSRARKQAYTNELEKEVSHLEQENAKLRRQYQELRSAMAAQIIPTKKKKLRRASSAPL